MAIRENDTQAMAGNTTTRRVVAVFKNHEDVEHVIRALKDRNYDMDRVSLLARHVEDVAGADELHDADNRDAQGNEAREGAGIGATTGTVLGGVTGFLIGVGVLAIPGVGPVLAAGAEIGALGSTLAGAGIGAATGGIVGALVGMGIPEERAKAYENRVKAGDYLLIITGNDNDLDWIQSTMRDRHAEELEVFGPRTDNRTERVENRRGQDFNKETVGTRKTYDLDNDNEPEVIVVDKTTDKHRQV